MTKALDDPIYSIAVAAQAAIMQKGALRIWFARKRIVLTKGEFDPGNDPTKMGDPRLLTLRTVLTISAAAALVRAGVDVATAYCDAKAWTWMGEGDRDPAALYEAPAFTCLIRLPDGQAQVVPSVPDASGRLPFEFGALFPSAYPVRKSPTIVMLNHIDKYARGVCAGALKEI